VSRPRHRAPRPAPAADSPAMLAEIAQVEQKYVNSSVFEPVVWCLLFNNDTQTHVRYAQMYDELLLALYWRDVEMVAYSYDAVLTRLRAHLEERETMASGTTVIK
jgi:hypothetical protein